MSPLKKHPAIAALIIIVLIGLATGAVVLINQEHREDSADTTTSVQSNSTSSTTSSSGSSTSTTDSSTTYKDGTYIESATYISPGGRETVTVGLTIKNGVVTDSSFSATASDRDAREYQSMFSGSYKSQVVGKAVNSISLSRVAGASLTTNGFNDALEQIKSDAKA